MKTQTITSGSYELKKESSYHRRARMEEKAIKSAVREALEIVNNLRAGRSKIQKT